MSNGPESGWYSDPEQPGADRFWDGTAWADQRRPSAAPVVAAPEPPSKPKRRGWRKMTWLIASSRS